MSEVEFPQKLKFLFKAGARYRVAYGGRGGAKSWGFARALLILGASKPLRILCAREIQKSIKDSVHQLLTDQIAALGLDSFYTIQNNQITGKNGTQFGFEGLKHNITNIKSWEGADICWVEEAHTVSKSSWDVLIPTIRKENSEIWITFNPELEEDETYQRFVINKPPNAEVVKVNWNDNPWFPDVLLKELEYMREKDPTGFKTVWEGECRQAIEGAIFAKELQLAAEEGRIREVPYDPSIPVDTFWDLGHSDQTAIWFAQIVGMEIRVLNYYSNSQEKFQHYIKHLQNQPYAYGTHYLPHDAAYEQLGQEKTIELQARAALGKVQVIPRVQSKANSIEAGRAVFPMCYFDKEKCSDGLSSLRRYAYKRDEQTGKISQNPEHNIWSHAADAWQQLGMSLRKPQEQEDELDMLLRKQRKGASKGTAWWL
jgi:phage terminase large subunit